jgi:hypothetical protein
MASRESGETLLNGPVADQAALHGVLNRIHSLGLSLLLVARSGCPCTSKNCPRRGQCQACAAHHAANGKQPYCFRGGKWDKRCTVLIEVRK